MDWWRNGIRGPAFARKLRRGERAGLGSEEGGEPGVEEGGDFLFSVELEVRSGSAELGLDLVVVKVKAFDLVIMAAAFDSRPVDD